MSFLTWVSHCRPPSFFEVSRHVLHWSSPVTHRTVKSTLVEGVHACSEMVGHMELLLEFYASFVDTPPGDGGIGVLREPFFLI